MSRPPPSAGEYINVYFPAPLYHHIIEQAKIEDVSIGAWVRDRLLELAPQAVQEQVRLQPRSTSKAAPKHQPNENSKPQPAPKPSPPSFDDLVEKYRDRILDLDAKAYSPNAIGAVLHVPYRVVSEVLYRKAAPKKGAPK